MESDVTLTFRFPKVQADHKMERTESGRSKQFSASTTAPNKTCNKSTRTILLPSLSETLPARIYRRSTRLSENNYHKQQMKKGLLTVINNSNENKISKSSSHDKNTFSRTREEQEKILHKHTIKQNSSQTQETSRQRSHKKQNSQEMLNSANHCYAFLQNDAVETSEIILSKMEAKRMTSTEKCKKWLKEYFMEEAKLTEDEKPPLENTLSIQELEEELKEDEETDDEMT